jgi:glycosyltransferase involved in cell wall biosynthesis
VNTDLTILSVAYPLLTVSSGSAGGAEQILRLIDRGLVQGGVRSIVVAAEGSEIAGKLIATPAASGEITDRVRAQAQEVHRTRIGVALQEHKIDLIHFHGLDFCAYRLRNVQTPQLATLHLPVSWYPADLFAQSDISLNCVSDDQARSSSATRSFPIVRNGIDLDSFHLAQAKQDYLIWLGRICPEKGVEIALRVAHRLQLPMIIGGPVHPFEAHQTYFQEQVQPLLDDQRCYVGALNFKDKAELLAKARCLLVPSLVAETSSLVSMEAISSGTPVIAFRTGALAEIVDEGITGFLVESEGEMIQAVGKTKQISPDNCRSIACSRFSATRMIADYLELYRHIMLSQSIHA